PSPEALRSARDYLAYRFPGLKDAPLVEARVCQYENSPDEHFIIDRHPAAANAWLVGGGSGHGFKHGPALGELVARLVLGQRTPPRAWRSSCSRPSSLKMTRGCGRWRPGRFTKPACGWSGARPPTGGRAGP